MEINCCIVAIVSLVAHIIGLGIYAGYNIKLRERELELERRTKELEKKNGAELEQLNQLKKQLSELQTKLIQYEKNKDPK